MVIILKLTIIQHNKFCLRSKFCQTVISNNEDIIINLACFLTIENFHHKWDRTLQYSSVLNTYLIYSFCNTTRSRRTIQQKEKGSRFLLKKFWVPFLSVIKEEICLNTSNEGSGFTSNGNGQSFKKGHPCDLGTGHHLCLSAVSHTNLLTYIPVFKFYYTLL